MMLIIECAGPGFPGSRVDWLSQHAAFADYFRKRFYQTHELFPQFASGIGGGQNIYYFAYYGLFSPFVLLSYLFPFIQMEAWLVGAGAAAQAASGVLCFLWLEKRVRKAAACFGALILELSTAVTYHSYFQIMFVDYMPFLLLILIGADTAQDDKGRGRGVIMMAAGSLLVILTSYYYAPASMLTVLVYLFMTTPGGGKYFRRTLKRFLPAVCGCLLSLFYLVPVSCAIFAGRGGGGSAAHDLLIPELAADNFFYSPYGLGLTALPLFAVCVWLVSGRRREAAAALIIAAAMVIPAFAFVMNGGLYARSKIFLPMLPLAAMLSAQLIENIRERKISARRIIAGCALCAIFAAAGAQALPPAGAALLAADLGICASSLFLYYRSRRYRSLLPALIVIICVSAGTAIYAHGGQTLERLMRQIEDSAVGRSIETALEREDSAVRVVARGNSDYENACVNRTLAAGQLSTTVYSSLSNPHYRKFQEDISLPRATRNRLSLAEQHDPLFLRFMGVKYTAGVDGIRGNNKAAPVFYVTDGAASPGEFKKLSWQQKQIALCEYAFAPGGKGFVRIPLSEISAEFSGTDGNAVNAKIPAKGTLRLSRPVREGETLFVSFRVKNRDSDRDAAINIGGVRNMQSCRRKNGKRYGYHNGNNVFHYTINAKAGTSELPVIFESGDLEIGDISVTSGSVDEDMSASLYSSPAAMKELRSGNGFEGTVKSGGKRLITSLPYDEGFRVTADGREVKTEIVNDGFLGAKIPDETSHIRIEYRAPGSAAGAAASAIVLIAGIVYAAARRKIICRPRARAFENGLKRG